MHQTRWAVALACLTLGAASVAAARVSPAQAADSATTTLSTSAPSASTNPVRACATLALVTFEDGSRVTSAQEVAAQRPTPAHCRVTVLVPERINIIVLLPQTSWNGRYQATGNGVYAGVALPPTGAVAEGYAASSTDTGHQSALLTGEWAWSPTGMNHAQIQDFAYRANHEMAVKSKALINIYYGVPPTYSYWNGCSTGGREGITEAVRYPHDFDGIYAGAPAINWTRFIPAEEWPQVVMNELGNFLPACKANAVAGIVLEACDPSDGLQDGLYDARECDFDAQSLLGRATPCGAFTQADVDVIAKIWEGPRRPNGEFLWYGLLPGASLTSLAGTIETPAGSDGNPFLVSNEWFKWFLHKDPTWDWHTLTFESYATDFDQSVFEWGDVLGTNNPDLRAFRDSGGRIVIWHGLADPLIFAQGTIDYWERVLAELGGAQSVHPFARMFLAPNVGHCSGGGPEPGANGFAAVVKWVEQGIPPDQIIATSGTRTRPLCPYPQVARYLGAGSIEQAENFACVAPSIDLAVSRPALSTEKLRGGDNVTFSSRVSNRGTISAVNVVVRFLVDGVQLGTDQTLSTLPAGGDVTVTSAIWSAKQEFRSHIVQVVVDPANTISEADRANNTASTSFTVQGNKIRNGSFEQSADSASPDGWSGSGATSYDQGGSDGSRSVSAQPGGSWTSAPVAVTPGTSYQALVQTSGAGGTLLVEQLAADGRALAAATQQILPLAIFQPVAFRLTTRSDAAQLRVVLLGPLSGRTSFDDVRLTDS